MAKLGSPPAASVLRQLDPPWVRLRAGEDKLARIYHASGPHPVAWNQFRTWGPARNARFDHHQPDASDHPRAQSRGILYCATQGMTCLAEVFQGTRVVNRTDDDPYLCVFACTRNLKLLDLTGEFATRMGASLAMKHLITMGCCICHRCILVQRPSRSTSGRRMHCRLRRWRTGRWAIRCLLM
jgi:hypothetical protein